MKNPFLPVAEFPDFPAMTPAAAEEALPKLLAEAKARVDALEKTAVPTWDGFVCALDDTARPLWEAWSCISHLLSVANNAEWRRVETKFQGEIVAFSLRVGQSKRFYELAKRTPADTPVRKRILEKMVRGAELSGVALDGEKQKRFNEIQVRLDELGNTFRDHVLDATKAYKLPLATAKEVDGLPATVKAAIAEKGKAETGPWSATIDDATYMPFMKHSKNRDARAALYHARATRASIGAFDNTKIIDEILALRKELAHLLGFANYAELSLASKSAPSIAAVRKMIDDLAVASKPAGEREAAQLATFAKEHGQSDPIRPWDRSFWSERQREQLYSYSEDELSRYFNLPVVLNGLFKLVERLFGITVEDADWTAPVWHPDVRFFRVKNEKGEVIAHFYFDPYSRPGAKRGGAWMNHLRARRRRADGTVELPLALICCNQAVPTGDGRALMRFDEVDTLFHEFGHALQHMLTTVDDEAASGLGLIEWDAVEIASQFMENWCYDPATLKSFARNAETNELIPDSLIERLRAAKNYRAATASLRQLSFAKLDFELHTETPADPNAFKQKIFDELTPDVNVPEDRFLCDFTHIFAGGYAAGYYGYKWSEVISADVFGAFEDAGLADDAAVRRVGRAYRDTFLSLGGGTDPMEVFRRFRGRAPSIDALLRQTGLK